MILARLLNVGDQMMLDGNKVVVDRINYHPTEYIGGEAFKTAKALQIHFTNGERALTHPDAEIALVVG